MDHIEEQILRRRMHGLYLSRKCEDLQQLSHELLGLHCWFHRNVAFSALIRGASLRGWKQVLTKTWLYRGTLHGVVYEDLPALLALHPGETYLKDYFGEHMLEDFSEKVLRLMEDGVYSRAEMRRIFAEEYDARVIEHMFSSWGGIFVYLARQGKVAFRDMASRDFDLIDCEPTETAEEVLPELLGRYFAAYGPATLNDAAMFFGLWKQEKKKLDTVDLSVFAQLKHGRQTYYYVERGGEPGEIPEMTLLSGFDPLIVSYADRGLVLPAEYKANVILKSGICLPTILVNGQVEGIWNIKKNQPVVEFFSEQPDRLQRAARELADDIRMRTV